ncbi:MAG: hypothetical protein JNM30_15155, partial [Rhodospirillales bacterium]|nr:hypothetical protein [Rhodospirillales bacterium]
PVDVRAQKVQIFNPAGAELATLDEVSIGLSFPALLTGLVAPSSLDIRRPTVRLTRARDGHFEFGLGDSGGAGGQQPALQQLLEGLLSPPDPEIASGYLERVSISDAALTLDDQMLEMSWRAREATVELVRSEGAIDADFRGTLIVDDRPAKLSGKLRHLLDSGSTELQLAFNDLVPSKFARGAPALERLAALDLPVSGTSEARLLPTGKVDRVSFDINGGKGRLRLKEVGGSVDIAKARVIGKLEQDLSICILDNVYLDLGGPDISAAALVSNITDSAEARINVVARRFAVSDLERLWPADMRPDLRAWVREHVRTGRADESTLLVVGRLGADGFEPDLKSLRMETRFIGVGGEFGGGMTVQDLSGTAKVSPDQVEVVVTDATASWPKSGLPTMTEIKARAGLVPNRRADVFISSAKIGGLMLGDAQVRVQGLDQPAPEVSGDAVIRGPAGRFFQMMQKTEVGGVGDIGNDGSAIKGDVTARTLFRFDAGNKFSPDRIQRSAAARITGLAVPAGPMGLAISDGDVTMQYDARDVKVAGQLKVNGSPVAMELNHTLAGPTKDRMHLRVSGTMTDEQRRQFGLGLDKQVSGPIDFDVDVTRDATAITTANARLKLDRAKVKLQQIYWEKPQGVPGVVNLTLTARKDKPTEISEFSASGGGLKAEGRAWLKPGTSDIQRMELDTLQFGGKDGTSVYADFTRTPGNGWKVDLAGDQLNLQPYIDDPDILLDFPLTVNTQLRRLRLSPERALNDVRMSAAFGGQYWDKIEIESKLDNRSELSVRYIPAGDQRDLLVYATDAGAVLQMMSGSALARDLRGGELAIRATREPTLPNTPTEGLIQMRGFSLRDTPTGDRILASAQGFGPFEVLASEDLNFSRLEANFRKSGDRVELKNMMALSRGLGMNASGGFDLANNQMNVTGYVSPFRGIGQILDENPWVGAFLANVDKQGLIAVPFTGSGAMSEPDFKVDKKPQPLPQGQMREFARLATGKDRDLSAESRMKPAGMNR